MDKIKNIKLLIMDVDGVLTDGKIIITEDGKELKNFSVIDGTGLTLFLKAGLKLAIISGRKSKAVDKRAKELGIKEVHQEVLDKLDCANRIIKKYKIPLSQVAYIGDDVNDLPLMKKVGFAVAVANAPEEVKASADYLTKRGGGEGAVREVIELILKAKNIWDKIIKNFVQAKKEK